MRSVETRETLDGMTTKEYRKRLGGKSEHDVEFDYRLVTELMCDCVRSLDHI